MQEMRDRQRRRAKGWKRGEQTKKKVALTNKDFPVEMKRRNALIVDSLLVERKKRKDAERAHS